MTTCTGGLCGDATQFRVDGGSRCGSVCRVLLGTFHFTAGSVPDEVTPLRATDYDADLDDVVTSDLRVLDGSPIHEGRATISTIVPEPGTLVLLAAAVLSGAAVWLRRRKV
jgi:hypothetical protein